MQGIGNLIKTLPEMQLRNNLFSLHVYISQMCVKMFRDHLLYQLIPLVNLFWKHNMKEQTICTGCDNNGSSSSQYDWIFSLLCREKLLTEMETILSAEISSPFQSSFMHRLQDKRRLILMYAIARGLDSDTQRRLFQASGLPIEDYTLIQNLKLLHVNVNEVCGF